MFHDPIKLMHQKYNPNHGEYWIARKKETGKSPIFYRYSDNYTQPFFESNPLGASAFKTKDDLINCLSEWQKYPLEYIEENYNLTQVNEVTEPYYELKIQDYCIRPEIKWKSIKDWYNDENIYEKIGVTLTGFISRFTKGWCHDDIFNVPAFGKRKHPVVKRKRKKIRRTSKNWTFGTTLIWAYSN